MHSAPSVIYPVGRSRDADLLLFAVWALGAACAGAAIFQFDPPGVRAGLLALSVLLAGGAAWRLGRRTAPGELRFDGLYWSLSGATSLNAARAEVALDLQFLLLLRLSEPQRRRHWLWLQRRSDPPRWRDLRRAVYSRAPMASPAGLPADAAALGAPSTLR
jgi:toxin CptA